MLGNIIVCITFIEIDKYRLATSTRGKQQFLFIAESFQVVNIQSNLKFKFLARLAILFMLLSSLYVLLKRPSFLYILLKLRSRLSTLLKLLCSLYIFIDVP